MYYRMMYGGNTLGSAYAKQRVRQLVISKLRDHGDSEAAAQLWIRVGKKHHAFDP